MISYKESLEILKVTDALLDGHFILSSGLHSSQYIQCAKLLSKPNLANILCQSLALKIKNEFTNIDLILSPAMGGVIIGYEIGKILKKETIFAERLNRIFSLRRGFEIKKSSNVLIVEDVITTGKSSLECSSLVNDAKANILGYACIIDRSNGKSIINKKIISQVQINIPSYDEKNLPEDLLLIKPTKPGSRDL
jgi:orotate phosphoribosyltransferase|tara:strand:+ start:346 stop:927 length:582 start_codon:yes stop_codon:yes gene_type:complete